MCCKRQFQRHNCADDAVDQEASGTQEVPPSVRNIAFNVQVASSYTGNNGVTVSGTSATYIMIYAPGTDLTVSGGGPLYGSLVAKTLTVSGNSQIHQDLGLPCWQ